MFWSNLYNTKIKVTKLDQSKSALYLHEETYKYDIQYHTLEHDYEIQRQETDWKKHGLSILLQENIWYFNNCFLQIKITTIIWKHKQFIVDNFHYFKKLGCWNGMNLKSLELDLYQSSKQMFPNFYLSS